MTRYSVYIIYSSDTDRFYIGQTSNLEARLEMHRTKVFASSFSRIANDWELYWHVECESRSKAIAIESYIKKMRNRKYYYALKHYWEATENLLSRFR
jgi:putative endonuclease